MATLALVSLCVIIGVISAQQPAPCATPVQLAMRASQYNHEDDVMNRFFIAYDAVNKRKVIFEEENVLMPGRQLHEFLILNNVNIEYDFNMKTKECRKSIPRPWRPFGIPSNATFEDEFYIGGPGEEVFAQDWSDRVPYSRREMWIGTFSLKHCYPIREVLVAGEQVNTSITTNFHDIVDGIPNPGDFIPPPECEQAKWGISTRTYPW
ncbi:mammalian ependymin-related protein 1-like [Gigantopelta aegis]|uniref:mammalian ependymin-related protein 1-like n=1 Tax=Gigantopelta aegis TaxID=1735272 RepID=UPI001B88894F|nr:mammalian ependymin-related protein 1-like [Gigantopelta aegis]